MMYIITKDKEYGWHLGEPFPLSVGLIQEVDEVQADLDELVYVEKNFRNLSNRVARNTMRWFGDEAKFIAGNLM